MVTGAGRLSPGTGATGAASALAATAGCNRVASTEAAGWIAGLPAGSGAIGAAGVGVGALSTVDALRARAVGGRERALADVPGPSVSDELELACSLDIPRGR